MTSVKFRGDGPSVPVMTRVFTGMSEICVTVGSNCEGGGDEKIVFDLQVPEGYGDQDGCRQESGALHIRGGNECYLLIEALRWAADMLENCDTE